MTDDAHVVMLLTSGKGEDSQWFDFKSGGYSPTTRVEWDLGTMNVVLPQTIATVLIRNGHARLMTPKEKESYTLSSTPGVAPDKGSTNIGD